MSKSKTEQTEQAREATEAEIARQAMYLDTRTELAAMQAAFDALYKLPDHAKRRAMRWLDEAIWAPRRYDNEEPPF